MDKEDVTHTHTMKYYVTMRKNEILSPCRLWRKVEGLLYNVVPVVNNAVLCTYLLREKISFPVFLSQ